MTKQLDDVALILQSEKASASFETICQNYEQI